VILGFFATPVAVGLFASADKVRQAAVQVMWPINQSLFPHQSQVIQEDPARALRMVRRSLWLLGGAGVIFGVVIVLGAPLIVRILFGQAFTQAVPVLRCFGLLIPLHALSVVISFQWMLPLGFDRQFNFVVFTSGIITIGLGILLTPRWGALGMAIAVNAAQAYSLVAIHFVLSRRALSPLGSTILTAQSAHKQSDPEMAKI
jgi:PST family polysaccharide transporter